MSAIAERIPQTIAEGYRVTPTETGRDNAYVTYQRHGGILTQGAFQMALATKDVVPIDKKSPFGINPASFNAGLHQATSAVHLTGVELSDGEKHWYAYLRNILPDDTNSPVNIARGEIERLSDRGLIAEMLLMTDRINDYSKFTEKFH